MSFCNPVRSFLSHVLRNFIEDKLTSTHSNFRKVQFLSHVLRNFIEEQRSGQK